MTGQFLQHACHLHCDNVASKHAFNTIADKVIRDDDIYYEDPDGWPSIEHTQLKVLKFTAKTGEPLYFIGLISQCKIYNQDSRLSL